MRRKEKKKVPGMFDPEHGKENEKSEMTKKKKNPLLLSRYRRFIGGKNRRKGIRGVPLDRKPKKLPLSITSDTDTGGP